MDTPLEHRSLLLAAGFTDKEVRRQLRSGALRPVRPGCYLRGPEPDSAAARHGVATAAALAELAAGSVLSHVSAAVRHGLPVWRIALSRVHVTRARRSGGRAGRLVHVHTAALDDAEIVSVRGSPTTTPARTVVDVARTVGFEEAVAVADAALHAGLVTPAQLAAALARAAGWPGAPAARRVVAAADGRSESVGETRSRLAIRRAGLPAPVPQWEVLDRTGRLVGRADFGWPGLRTVGEFDGMVKYGTLLRAGRSATEVVVAGKRREDAIRAEGFAVVRWTWSDLSHFDPIAAALRNRFAAN